jgi:hypothetical protein
VGKLSYLCKKNTGSNKENFCEKLNFSGKLKIAHDFAHLELKKLILWKVRAEMWLPELGRGG